MDKVIPGFIFAYHVFQKEIQLALGNFSEYEVSFSHNNSHQTSPNILLVFIGSHKSINIILYL